MPLSVILLTQQTTQQPAGHWMQQGATSDDVLEILKQSLTGTICNDFYKLQHELRGPRLHQNPHIVPL